MTDSTLMGHVFLIEAGEDDSTHTDILNCKSIKWKKNQTISPRLLPSAKVPQGWLQSHSWIDGEFSLVTASDIFETYAPEDADAIAIPYFMVTSTDVAKATVTWTFTGLIITSIDRDISEGGEGVFTYKFLAYSVEMNAGGE